MNAICGPRLASSAILSSFVEMFLKLGVSSIVLSRGSSARRRSLLRRVPSGWFPHFIALTAALRLPAPPFRLPSRFAHGSALRRRTRDLPSSSATLATHALVVDSGGSYPGRPPGLAVPTLRLLGLAFRALCPVGTRNFPDFGALFYSLRARCLRFASVVTFRSRKTRYRLAALPWPGGTLTRWVAAPGFFHVGLHGSPPGRGFAWRTGGLGG